MRIQQIKPNLNFEAKKRFLDQQQYNDLRVVLEKMNSEVEYTEDESGMHFASRLIGRICTNDLKSEIIDRRYFISKVSRVNQMVHGNTELVLDNIKLEIDNKTAEIVSWEKPFFTSWKTIMKNTSSTLKLFKDNFANSKVVKKYPFGISGFTEKGAKALDAIVQKVQANTVAQKFIFRKVVK